MTHVPYPEEQGYVELIGRLVYTVTYLESLIVRDLINQTQVALAPSLGVSLLDETTGGIANAIGDNKAAVTGPVRAFLDASEDALRAAAKLRNSVLHALPITTAAGFQQLQRNARGEDFPVTSAYLSDAIDKVYRLIADLGPLRVT